MPEIDGAARILAHWARFKVLQHDVPDDTIADAIVSKIKDTAGISYADIAEEVGGLDFPYLHICVTLLCQIIAILLTALFGNKYQISWSNISFPALFQAHEKGRPHLAIKLLDHEPKASKQGHLLLKMKEDKLALKKAIESGDTDFIYYVLLEMR